MAIRKEKAAADFLKEVSLFDGLQDNALSQIFKLGKASNFRAGDIVIKEGQPGGNLYIVINGRAEVSKNGKVADKAKVPGGYQPGFPIRRNERF